jgi:hypothetical protein
MDRRTFSAALAAGCFAAASEALGADDDRMKWGNLSATFVYDGEPPPAKLLAVPGAKLPVTDRSLVVDPQTKGIANVLMWMHVAPGVKPPVHPEYTKLLAELVKLEFRDSQLEPRITLVVVDQDLEVQNNDAVGYNLKGDFFANPLFGALLPAGGAVTTRFRKAESRPMPLSCVIHPWITGSILIRNNPYMAATDRTGSLQIKNVPIGTQTFIMWHELSGYVTTLKKDGETHEFRLGRITLDIKPGDNDLGVMHIKPERKK